jgi:UDP-N-acetylglucosamine:LPS N-acetylglucosamine transferase
VSRLVLFACSLGGAGHFNPLKPFMEAAKRRGDDVLLVVPPSLAATAAASGHRYLVGDEPHSDDVAAIRERLVAGPPDEVAGLADRELFGRMCTAAMLPAMEQVVDSCRPDLVMREPCEYSSAVVATARGIPHALVAISMAEIEHSVLSLVAPVLARYGEQVVEQIRAGAYLTQFPESLDPSPFARTIRFRHASEISRQPLPDWWNGSDAPLLYVTFGSVAGSTAIAATVYRAALDAAAQLEARVLLTIGRHADMAALGPIPGNVHVEQWVPQEEVLPHAAAVLCHGGSGTTLGALAAGVPLVILPLFADQLANGPGIAKAGAGLCIEPRPAATLGRSPFTPDDVPRIADAVTKVLSEPRFSKAAQRLAEEMRSVRDADSVLNGLKAAG